MNRNNTKAKQTIEDAVAAEAFVADTLGDPVVGLDTEFMRVRTYFPELCLLQLASCDGTLACVDPLVIDPAVLGRSLSRLDGTVVIHSAGQDLEVLQHALAYLPGSLFDTQVAAALLGFGEQVSYASLVNDLIGVEVAKGETRTDWSRRPLSSAQVAYAFDDVAYLIEIQQLLEERLVRDDKLNWMRLACEEMLELQRRPADDSVIARFKGGAGLPVSRQALLRDLLLWRERKARELNRPREWVVSGADLVAIARQCPDSENALGSCAKLNPAQLRKHAGELLSIVAASRDAEPVQVWQQRTEMSVEQRARVKSLQGRVRSFCEQLSITPSAVASRADIEALVLGRPSRLDGGWRRDLLADAFAGFV